MAEKSAKLLRVELDAAYQSLSRYATQLETARRDSARYYNALRSLENAIRGTIVIGERVSNDDLVALLRRIPKHPRPTTTELRKKRR